MFDHLLQALNSIAFGILSCSEGSGEPIQILGTRVSVVAVELSDGLQAESHLLIVSGLLTDRLTQRSKPAKPFC